MTDVNEAPTGTDSTVSLLEDGSHSFSVADFGFADSEGDTLNSIRIESLPTEGTLTLNGFAVNQGVTIKSSDFPNLVYTPAADFNGPDSFDFTVEDLRQRFASDSNTLSFDIVSVNDDPVAVDDFGFTTQEDTPITIALSDLLANDSDAEGDTLQIDAFGAETNGTVQSNGDGTYTFTPDANFNGVASFNYVVNDGNNATDQGTVEIIVGAANDDPLAVDDEFTTLEDTAVTILPSDLLANDNDPDGDTPQVVAVDANSTTNGTLQVTDDGSFTYTPNANFFGTDSFTYAITDGNGGTAQATVNINVTSVNDAPTVGGFNEIRLADLTPSLIGPNASFTDNAGHNDAQILINGQNFYNGIGLHPVSPSSFVEYDLNGATEFSAVVGLNDTLFQAGEVVFRAFVDGVEVFNSTDVVGGNVTTDTPALPISFDTTGGTTLRLEVDTAGIQGADHAVFANAMLTGPTQVTTISVAESAVNGTLVGTYSGSDVDGDTLTYSLADNADGRFEIDADTGEIRVADASLLDFETENSHSIIVEVDDQTTTVTQTLQIQLSDINEVPTGTNNTISILEDGSRSFSAADFGFLDPEGGELRSILVMNLPTGGTLELNGEPVVVPKVIEVADLPNLVYTPNSDANGADYDSFDFRVRDAGQLFSSDANTLTIDVNSVNDLPIAQDDAATALEDAVEVTGNLLDNDSDIDGDTLTVNSTPVNGPANGTLTLSSDGTFVYTPDADFNGTDSFTYEVNDGNGGIAQATVEIEVVSVNDAPVAVDDSFATSEDTALTIEASEILANDNDIDGDTLQIASITTDPTNGTVALNGDGTFTYTPNENFFGNDSFTYELTDGNGGRTEAIVNLTVSETNDAPTIRLTNLINSLEENLDTTNSVKVANIVISDDNLGVNDLSLSGADASNFEIVGDELRLAAGVTLDFENKTTFDVTVQVDDATLGSTVEDSIAYTLNVADVNESPTVSLVNVNQAIPFGIALEPGLRVADILIEDDALGIESLQLAGPDADLFEIVGNELRLNSNYSVDPTRTSLSVAIQVDDLTIGETFEDLVDLEIESDQTGFGIPAITNPNSELETASELEVEDDTEQEMMETSDADNEMTQIQPIVSTPIQNITSNNDSLNKAVATQDTDGQTNLVITVEQTEVGDLVVREAADNSRTFSLAKYADLDQTVVGEANFSTRVSNHFTVSGSSLTINLPEESTASTAENSLALDQVVVGSSAIATTSLSVGYVIWMLRGGSLFASFVSSLPAWSSFDLLPVLDKFDEESLADIADN